MRMAKAGLAGAMRPVVLVCGRTCTAKPHVRVAGAQAAGLTTAALPGLAHTPDSAPAGAYLARTLHPVVTECMPMHATIIRGRRHLRVALEISESGKCFLNAEQHRQLGKKVLLNGNKVRSDSRL